MTTRAEEIIHLHDREENKMTMFRNLCQEVADLMYPSSNDITVTTTPGRDLSIDIRDPSALFALDKAAAGYIANWIPKDRLFCGIRLMNREVADMEVAKRWSSLATQILHDEIFASNYMQQLQQTVKCLLAFGLADSYSEFSTKLGSLNFKNWHIKTFIFKENSRGVPDCVSVKFTKTARQLCEEFANPGEEVVSKANELKTESAPYEFIHIVRPRINRNRWLVDNLNMPYESLYVNVKEKIVVEEGGFEQQPYTVSRWEHSVDKYGRGRGMTVLSITKELQQMHKDLLEMGNRFCRFPFEVVRDDLENDEVDLSPDAKNYVRKTGSIAPIAQGATGNFPVTREILEYYRDMVKNDGFYNDIFSQFMSLRGDRRVQLELELRNQEGLDQLVSSVSNVESEFFTPQLTRCVILLMKNGRIPPPPQELQGQDFGIEYMGKLAMAAKQYQARGFVQFSQFVTNFRDVYPEAGDIINLERTIPDVARAMGMKEEHINTPEEIQAKRQQREQEKAQMMELAQMQAESEAYKNTSKSPESGSPAERMAE
jgi:hypothetical protein